MRSVMVCLGGQLPFSLWDGARSLVSGSLEKGYPCYWDMWQYSTLYFKLMPYAPLTDETCLEGNHVHPKKPFTPAF